MVTRRKTHLLPFLVLAGLASCGRDNAAPSRTPSIEFRTDPGYTWRNDTLPAGDTLLVGVVIKRGSDPMHHFKVTQRFDNSGPFLTTDSVRITADEFTFERTIILRPVAGQEHYRFNVVENDGDVIRRSLVFTVVD
jgi:hypothetical protein